VDLQVRYLALLDDWFVAEHRDEVKILKRRVDDGLAAEQAPGGPSVEAGGSSQTDGQGPVGVVLEINPPLSGDDMAALFRAAWGDQAPDSPPAIDRCLAHLGAYWDGRLVGFVKLAWDGGLHAFVLDTTVHPDHQRQGIGRRLIERVAEVAGRAGVEWLHVDYDPALEGFYARCGFRPTLAGLIRLGDG
jgi:GNAT superfamily N-acetyltransferase